jgi:hypothetical protein
MKLPKAVLEDFNSRSKNHSDPTVVAAIAELIGESNFRAPTTGWSTPSVSVDVFGGLHG